MSKLRHTETKKLPKNRVSLQTHYSNHNATNFYPRPGFHSQGKNKFDGIVLYFLEYYRTLIHLCLYNSVYIKDYAYIFFLYSFYFA